jgi:nitroreductase
MKKLQEALNWRYAVKKFDTAKKIVASDFEQLKEAVKLTPSSYGLQPFKVLVIEDAD